MFEAYFTRSGIAAFTAVVAIGIAGCGAPTSTGDGNAGAGTAAGGEATNGEAAAVPFTNARYGYRIDAPGKMTAATDGVAAFVGPSERLQIVVVEGAQAADPAALAHADIAGLPATATDFRLESGPATIAVNGHRSQKFVYSWSAGTSQVTGKPVKLVSVRYYVPRDLATVAVITYGIVSNQYDPQGADDVASTFRWQ
jgi:hypothetical protein